MALATTIGALRRLRIKAAPAAPAAPGTMPVSQTVPFSAITPVGYGGHPMYYGGAKFLGIVGGDPSGAFRINLRNELVLAGNVTTTPAYPASLAASYSLQVAEFEDAARTVRTDAATTYAVTVPTTGSYTYPAQTIMVAASQGAPTPRTLPAQTIDIARTRFISEWPVAGTAGDSLSRTTGGNNQISKSRAGVPTALGDFIALRPVAFNPPYSDGVHAGTVDVDIRPNTGVPTGTWTGTLANEYADGNYLTVFMEDPANTAVGFLQWSGSYTRWTRGYYNRQRASLNRTTFVSAYTGNSSPAQGGLYYNGDWQCIRFDLNIFDTQFDASAGDINGTQSCGLLIVRASGSSVLINGCVVVDNVFGTCHNALSLQDNSPDMGGNQNSLVLRNETLGYTYNDIFKLAQPMSFKINDNLLLSSRVVPPSAHPDNMQLLMTTVTGDFPGGEIARNYMLQANNGGSGGGQGIFVNFGAKVNTAAAVGMNIHHNIIMGLENFNAIYVGHAKNSTIEHNTCVQDTTLANTTYPTINVAHSETTTVRNNVTASAVMTDPSYPTNTLANNVVAVPGGAITNVMAFAAPAYGLAVSTKAQAAVAFKAKTAGPLDGTATDATCVGMFNTAGANS